MKNTIGEILGGEKEVGRKMKKKENRVEALKCVLGVRLMGDEQRAVGAEVKLG